MITKVKAGARGTGGEDGRGEEEEGEGGWEGRGVEEEGGG